MSTASPAASPRPPAGRGRRILARILVVIGVLLLVISILSNFVKREALDTGHFRGTARELIASEPIRNQVAASTVEALYANVDVSGELQQRLPSNLQSLSGPIAGIARELADRAAREILQRPKVQELFVTAAVASQRQLVKVLEGDTSVVETTGGAVVLDVRPLVLRLGDRFDFVDNLADKIPEDAARITIMKSDELKTAQDLTQALKTVADWIWVLALAAWAAAIWLARGRRRYEVRAIAIGLIVVGIALLVIRGLVGKYIVDNLVASESVRPAMADVWSIITDSLVAAAWVSVIVGAIAWIGIWFTGPGRRATAWRGAVAPYLRRPELSYGVFVVLLLFVLWWAPIEQFRTVVILAVLALLGFEVVRRQAAREFPDAVAGDITDAMRARWEGWWGERGKKKAAAPGPPPGPQVDELERIAVLHEKGVLTDEEFAAAKAKLLG